jgi:hypothetical protein
MTISASRTETIEANWATSSAPTVSVRQRSHVALWACSVGPVLLGAICLNRRSPTFSLAEQPPAEAGRVFKAALPVYGPTE